MDLNQLRTLVTVAETASLTRAASQLFLSQPAVSAHIKSLETEFNVRLFKRTPRGMELTASGLIMRDEARLALDAVSKFVNRARSLHATEICALGTISVPVILNLPQVLSQLRQRHQNVSLTIRQNISGHIIDSLLAGELDAGFIIGEVHGDRLGVITVSPITLCIVGPRPWKAQLETAGWDKLQEFPWIATPEKCSFSSIARDFLQRHGVSVQPAIVADQEKTLAELVAMEAGITLMREDIALVLQDNEELYIWPGEKTVSQLCFVWDREKETSPVVAALIDTVRDIWQVPA
ncbi:MULTISPECIES: LysR family transcriptional regulator [Citrobacter]|uniref:LysR family transcriptional regulator n=1 Tax=Citrobacter koseri TaxID=545 RepID=A0A3S4IAM1_CITKO|nr:MULTISPECIES: LysR family transcriptional regulator [Citrobacter]MBJ8877112.1 LysR family transcriptional regulator [Citrobacter koseri]MBJ9236708.1 LysR family transcriptional regulator [Citrobacter koseri]MDM2967667.1 LysR family transcriptional regulator [Citrobacter sp. CK199]MDM2976672.1 LysR family transcriptional regulator [Citrobacter sp. CK200]VEB91405.1 LysR family transcriptional regulator [Citrobacter koseri]